MKRQEVKKIGNDDRQTCAKTPGCLSKKYSFKTESKLASSFVSLLNRVAGIFFRVVLYVSNRIPPTFNVILFFLSCTIGNQQRASVGLTS